MGSFPARHARHTGSPRFFSECRGYISDSKLKARPRAEVIKSTHTLDGGSSFGPRELTHVPSQHMNIRLGLYWLHWSVLGSMSIDGFRRNYFVRQIGQSESLASWLGSVNCLTRCFMMAIPSSPSASGRAVQCISKYIGTQVPPSFPCLCLFCSNHQAAQPFWGLH